MANTAKGVGYYERFGANGGEQTATRIDSQPRTLSIAARRQSLNEQQNSAAIWKTGDLPGVRS